MLAIRYVPGVDDDTDIFTENTRSVIYEKHIGKIIGNGKYLSTNP